MNAKGMNKADRVKCWVRIKPTSSFANDMITILPDCKTLNVFSRKEEKEKSGGVNNQRLSWSFSTDGILHNTSQETVYNSVASEVASAALASYNGTVMCYGQTGAGKTYTMTGAYENYHNRGIIPRSLTQIFRESQNNPDRSFTFMVSYFEIYNEMIYDLLASSCDGQQQSPHLPIVENDHGVRIKGLKCLQVQTEEEALNLFFEGQINRAIASHALNDCSSRSHCVFTVYIESHSKYESDPKYMTSKLNLVDLAGSERLKKTQSAGKIREEATYINKTLLYLEHVIMALAEQSRHHVPFRQSKLTLFLKDSIGGCCHTRLIANVHGESGHIDETTSTLRFAMNMMRISARPVVNYAINPTAQIECLEMELGNLRKELALHDALANRTQISYDQPTQKEREAIKEVAKNFINGKIEDIEVVNHVQVKSLFQAFKALASDAAAEMDTSYRSKYILIDKSNQELVQAAQRAGLLLAGNQPSIASQGGKSLSPKIKETPNVAESKTSLASTVSGRGIKKKEMKKVKDKSGGRTSKAGSVSSVRPVESEVKVTAEENNLKKEEEEEKLSEHETVLVHPVAPPRDEQFEVFKNTAGSEINRILCGNKEMLASKKREYSLVAKEVNITKEEIDKSLSKINTMKCTRESEGLSYNEDGDIVITEAEYLEVQRLKDLKRVYREMFDKLKDLKSEILFCQNSVDQCRRKLLHEFDFWYFQAYSALLINGPTYEQQGAWSNNHNDAYNFNGTPADNSFHLNSSEKVISQNKICV